VPKYYPQGWAVKTNKFAGLDIAPCPDYSLIVKAFDGYGEKVEEPGEVRKAIERGLKAAAAGQTALIDCRLRPVSDIADRGEG
jgi:acetolactate synthase-1/2/3 large subunit